MAEKSASFPAHARSVKDVLENYKVTLEKGLASEEVSRLQEKYGPNELEKEERTPLWKLVLEQFDDLLVKILLGAAIISFLLALFDSGHEEGISAFIEPLVIFLILIANAVVGVWQESNAEKALEALKQLQSESAHVIRDGKESVIPARDLVPGDVVVIKVGDKVPADARLVQLRSVSMRVEQSQLTGESVSVLKTTDAVECKGDSVIQDRINMLFAATTVSHGNGVAVIVSTGMQTEIGKIQSAVQKAAEESQDTPLSKKLDEFGELLSKVIGIICLVVWVINYKNFFDPAHGHWIRGCIYYFKIAVALAVAAIPEGLPAVITTCLALGTRKMAKKNAIVRKLPSVETLGCTTVICSDKTGTLTTNEMSAVEFMFVGNNAQDLRVHKVEGITYAPEGAILGLQGLTESDKCLADLAKVCALCNDSSITFNGKFGRIGEPTEAALRVLVEKLGVPDVARNAQIKNSNRSQSPMACNQFWQEQYSRVLALEFSRDRKSMSVLCRDKKANKNSMFVKGAAENIIERSSHVRLNNGTLQAMTPQLKAALLGQVEQMANKSLRCLAFAVKEDCGILADYNGDRHPAHASLQDPSKFVEFEKQLIFCGLVGMIDPPRAEVRQSIELCQQAGIRVIVITGDNKKTAESICRKIGVFTEDESLEGKSFTGQEFYALSDAQKIKAVSGDSNRVFSRTEPVHKQELVRLLKKEGEIVAMTGDGVNDAPALKQADIGIAMGISGTEVAKEASDMVLADDNFATIVSAVEEGRSIYNNMKAFIRYLISSNIGEVASIFLTSALGIPEGFAPVQLLWVNLVTDGPPATALGFNPSDMDVMKKPPRKSSDSLINGWVFFRYMVIGCYVGIATVGVFMHWYMFYDGSNDGHTLVTFEQLSHWGQCQNWKGFQVNNLPFLPGVDLAKNPCRYFAEGKVKASTLSLSVLVTIEMFNALNNLSEDGSLLQIPPWANPWLLVAIVVSFCMHLFILYVPWFNSIFAIVPLDWNEWVLVLLWSIPVVFIDEVLKLIGRLRSRRELASRIKKTQ